LNGFTREVYHEIVGRIMEITFNSIEWILLEHHVVLGLE